VIILGVDKGKHGFPSEKETPALLDLLLPKAEDFAYAEERRLFYVALTRARPCSFNSLPHHWHAGSVYEHKGY
jgi:superfamily I DNA/RNA helicase